MDNKNSCTEIIKRICEVIGEEQDSQKIIEIKQNMDNCEKCKEHFKSIDATLNFCKNHKIELSDEEHNNLLDFLGLKE